LDCDNRAAILHLEITLGLAGTPNLLHRAGQRYSPDLNSWIWREAELHVVMGTFVKLVGSNRVGPFLFNLVRQKPRIRKTLMQVYHDRA
jgi:hypothetical protein